MVIQCNWLQCSVAGTGTKHLAGAISPAPVLHSTGSGAVSLMRNHRTGAMPSVVAARQSNRQQQQPTCSHRSLVYCSPPFVTLAGRPEAAGERRFCLPNGYFRQRSRSVKMSLAETASTNPNAPTPAPPQPSFNLALVPPRSLLVPELT